MTRAIRSYSEYERREVIKRRLLAKTGGLGYLAALEAAKYNKVSVPQEDSDAYPAAKAKALLEPAIR